MDNLTTAMHYEATFIYQHTDYSWEKCVELADIRLHPNNYPSEVVDKAFEVCGYSS
jgi:hypothetical protein